MASNLWDERVQEVHGGQTWRLCGDSFVEDFSVTTNPLGAPESAVKAVREALKDIHHYPAANCEEAVDALSSMMEWPSSRLLLGNGASELIDLVMRAAPEGGYRPGPYIAAYMEYRRAAMAAGRRVLDHEDRSETAAVTVIIRPNSPTGDFMALSALADVVDRNPGITLVDESFICFHGAEWRKDSSLSLIDRFPEKLMVVQSWTKLWSCPGLRLGSIACSDSWYLKLKRLQTPWSCNTLAQAFCSAAARDTSYMTQTWSELPGWKRRHINLIQKRIGWIANDRSPDWVPWIFVQCGSQKIAERATDLAQQAGCPVRPCASFGIPNYIRIGVRSPAHQDVLMKAWEPLYQTHSS